MVGWSGPHRRSLASMSRLPAMSEPFGRLPGVGLSPAHCLHKVWGLTAEQLAEPTVPPSTSLFSGLIRHMTEVERSWFRRRFAGEPSSTCTSAMTIRTPTSKTRSPTARRDRLCGFYP